MADVGDEPPLQGQRLAERTDGTPAYHDADQRRRHDADDSGRGERTDQPPAGLGARGGVQQRQGPDPARVGEPGVHAELGDTLIWFALPLLAAAVALTWLRRTAGDGASAGSRSRLGLVVAIIAVLIAAANVVQVYRIGESGARAVWHTTGAATPVHKRER